MTVRSERTRCCCEAGFTLIECVIVIGILAVIGSAVLFELTSVQSAANSKLGTAEISEIKKALLDFRRDTGSLPGQGVV